jgi:TRAP-type mannitol/chloroaromatic compound transport system permease small subunit
MKLISDLNEWIGKIIKFLLAPMIAIVCYDIVARYFFNRPTEWAMELTTHILVIYSILTGGFVMARGGHVNVEILYDRFSLRTKAVLSCITSIFFFSFVGIILWYGWWMAVSSYHYRETSGALMDWPIYPTKFVVPIGSFLLLLQGVVKFIQDLETAITGRPPKDLKKQSGMFSHSTAE